MKNFTEYLTESVKQYPFRVKIAGTVTAEKEEAMKGLLGRYTVSEKLEKVKKIHSEIHENLKRIRLSYYSTRANRISITGS